MNHWADFLVARLMKILYAIEVTGLQQGMTGPKFETTLGEFLSRVEGFYRAEGLIEPSSRFVLNPPINEHQLVDWYRNAKSQFEQIVTQIQGSVYEQFNETRLDGLGASQAYGELFRHVAIARSNNIVYATTNYDALGEMALDRLRFMPDAGDSAGYSGENHLRLDHLLEGMPRTVPVLHLHGKVGWLRRVNGPTVDPEPYFTKTQVFDRNYGVPIIMLPDPQKTYAGEDVLTALWAQFETALRRAKRVLVLGHSLADTLLVKALADNVNQPFSRLAITYFAGQQQGMAQAQASLQDLVQNRFGGQAAMIPMHFGIEPSVGALELDQWMTITRGLGIG